MAITFDSTGVTISTFQENYDALASGYYSIYGNDISLEPESPDGQRVGIEARVITDFEEFVLNFYNSIDPNNAAGDMLERLARLSAGITRRPSTSSQADLDVTTDRSVVIPEGYEVEDEDGQTWVTRESYELGVGTSTITVYSEQFGEITSPAGSISTPTSTVLGVQSVSNPDDAVVGVDEESDQQLRNRLLVSKAARSTTGIGAIFNSLASNPQVTDLAVYENPTNEFDPQLSLEDHSIWVVVQGGSVADIAESIAKSKDSGAGMKGDVTGIYNETLTNGNDAQEVEHVIYFDRPNVTQAFARVYVQSSVNINETAIKQAISDYRYRIGNDLVPSRLYSLAYGSQDDIVIENLEVSTNGVDYVTQSIDANPDTKFNFEFDNVQIILV